MVDTRWDPTIVINGVITLINGLINWGYSPCKRSDTLQMTNRVPLCTIVGGFRKPYLKNSSSTGSFPQFGSYQQNHKHCNHHLDIHVINSKFDWVPFMVLNTHNPQLQSFSHPLYCNTTVHEGYHYLLKFLLPQQIYLLGPFESAFALSHR